MKYSNEQIITAATTHSTMKAAADSLGMRQSDFNRRAKRLHVFSPNQFRIGLPRLPSQHLGPIYPLCEILDGLHPHYSTFMLKNRLFKENVKRPICEECGETDDKTSLELDHINGVSSDHRLENLRILCPNCHSRTVTYCGKNKTNSPKPTDVDNIIVDMILQKYNTHHILITLGMTPSGCAHKRVERIRKIVEYVSESRRGEIG